MTRLRPIMMIAILLLMHHNVSAQDLQWRSGTIVFVAPTTERILVAADSRQGPCKSGPYCDTACKIVVLDDQMAFVAAGMAHADNPTTDTEIYSSLKVAKEAFREVPTHDPEKIATLWGTKMVDIFERLAKPNPYAFIRGKILHQLVEGIVVSNKNGEYEAFEIDVGLWMKPDPDHIGWFFPEFWKYVWVTRDKPLSIGNLHAQDAIDGFFRETTQRAKIAHEQFVRNLPPNADIEAKGLEAALRYSYAVARDAGGDVDILELRPGKKPHWIQEKPTCEK